jgi:hypothetical protein
MLLDKGIGQMHEHMEEGQCARFVAGTKRVTLQEACALTSAGAAVRVVPELRGSGGGMSVSVK